MPPRGADDAEPSSRAATRSTIVCVSETPRKTRTSGCSRWNSPRSTGTTIAAGPVDAPKRRSPASSSDVAATSGDELLLERQHPLSSSIEPSPGLGRLHPSARAVEQLRSEPLLESSYLQRHRRLGHAEALRRLREAPSLDYRTECRELTRVHKESIRVISEQAAFSEPVLEQRIGELRSGRRSARLRLRLVRQARSTLPFLSPSTRSVSSA